MAKSMKLKDIRGEDSRELELALTDLEKERWQLSFASSEDVTNPARKRELRRTIARIKTVLRERQSAAKSAEKNS